MKKLFTLIFLLQAFISNGQSFAKNMGGTTGDQGLAVAVDAAGNVYTAGVFSGTADFDPGATVYNLTSAGVFDIFISKSDANGNFIWAKSIGGTSNDYARAIALDAAGNVYCTGGFTGTVDFDPGAGIFNLVCGGLSDVFISKLDAAGNFVWAKVLGGSGSNIGYGIVVDPAGNIYTTGQITSTADFDPGPAVFNLISAGSNDVFVSKLNAAGNFVWAKSMGGTGVDIAFGISVDAAGNVYTTGQITNTADFDPGPAVFNITTAGGNDIFVSKLNASGNFVWAKSMGGANFDIANRISVDAAGNVYSTGSFIGTADFDPGAGTFNLTSTGSQDIFISKIDAAGNFVWAKSMGGTGIDIANGILVDAAGNVYSTGQFSGTADFDPGASTFNLTSTGAQDIFISKIDAAGNFVWAKNMGGANADFGTGITLDASGNIYTTGYFSAIADFDPGTVTYNLTSAGSSDIFISKLNAQGQFVIPATGLNFDGVDDYVDCGNNASINNLGLSGFTLEAWVNISDPSVTSSIIRKTGDYNLYVNANNVYVEYWPNGVGTSTFKRLGGTITIAPNTWTHVAATWDGVTASLYVNGVLNNGAAFSTTVSGSENMWLGRSSIYGNIYGGSMDEVRIWNRPLCQAEIQNNMTGEINPVQQTGLKAYYQFNQGNAGGDNTGLTTIADISGNGNNGTLNTFALLGTTSNWTIGAVTNNAPVFVPPTLSGTAGGAQVCQSGAVHPGATYYVDGSCNLIAGINPSGASAVTGTINTCVKIDGSVQFYGGHPYVQRHYDITPATNAATATGTITLFYTQAEFDAYNLVRGVNPALPTTGADAAGIGNLLITQYHGTGTAPGNYSGAAVMINPTDNNIVWNNTLNRWEITFDVSGFSGFYVYTNAGGVVLPLRIVSFNGSKQNNGNVLQWQTSNEINTKLFAVERSTDGRSYTSIGTVAAKGTDNAIYYFTDADPFTNTIYYRLKMFDNDGQFTVSNTIKLNNHAIDQLAIYPNPVKDITTVQVLDKKLVGTSVKIINAMGETVHTFIIGNTIEILDVSKLAAGLYFLQTANGFTQKLIRQ